MVSNESQYPETCCIAQSNIKSGLFLKHIAADRKTAVSWACNSDMISKLPKGKLPRQLFLEQWIFQRQKDKTPENWQLSGRNWLFMSHVSSISYGTVANCQNTSKLYLNGPPDLGVLKILGTRVSSVWPSDREVGSHFLVICWSFWMLWKGSFVGAKKIIESSTPVISKRCCYPGAPMQRRGVEEIQLHDSIGKTESVQALIATWVFEGQSGSPELHVYEAWDFSNKSPWYWSVLKCLGPKIQTKMPMISSSCSPCETACNNKWQPRSSFGLSISSCAARQARK